MKELSLEQVGVRVKRVRTQRGYTREEFAEKVGISPQFLAEIENGKKGMSADTLFKICNRFDLSSDYILMGRPLADKLSDPIQDALKNFPEPFIELTEDVIKAIEKAIATK